MGDVQRIFYYHLPHAWVAFLLFFTNFLASIWYLVRRTERADALALASAEVGVVFCTVVLVTGPLWARPVWGICGASGGLGMRVSPARLCSG
jgi:heme exporter protein C